MGVVHYVIQNSGQHGKLTSNAMAPSEGQRLKRGLMKGRRATAALPAPLADLVFTIEELLYVPNIN